MSEQGVEDEYSEDFDETDKLGSLTAAAVAHLLQRRSEPKEKPRRSAAVFLARAARRVRGETRDVMDAWRVSPRVNAAPVQKLWIETIVARVEASLDASEKVEPNHRDDSEAWMRKRAFAVRAWSAAVSYDGSALLADVLEHQRLARAKSDAVERESRLLQALRVSENDDEDPAHVSFRRYMAETRAAVEEYRADLAADPSRAAFRDSCLAMLPHDSSTTTSDDTLGLARYRLGSPDE